MTSFVFSCHHQAKLGPDSGRGAATVNAVRALNIDGKIDRQALAACMRAVSVNLARGALAVITQPILVVCGEKDDLTGRPEGLAQAFTHGRAVIVPRRKLPRASSRMHAASRRQPSLKHAAHGDALLGVG